MPPPMALDAPPMQPPQVQAGGPAAPPMAGVGQMMANKAPGPGGPNGALVAKFEAVKKVLEGMSTDSSIMGPYVARAIAVLTSGIEEVVKTPGGIGAASPPPSPGSARPSGTGPGEGFPG